MGEMRSLATLPASMKIYLHFPHGGNDVERSVMPSDTFEAFKWGLHEEGLCGPPEVSHLSFGGDELTEGSETFQQHGIESGAAIFLRSDVAIKVTLLRPWTEWTQETWSDHTLELEVWEDESLHAMRTRIESTLAQDPAAPSPQEISSMIWQHTHAHPTRDPPHPSLL